MAKNPMGRRLRNRFSTPSENRAVADRFFLTAVLLATAMTNLDQSSVAVALPTLRRVFDAPVTLIQWVVLAYQIAVIAALLVAGRLADLLGTRRIFLVGLILFTLASGLCSLALSAGQIIAFRGLQGIGAALLLASVPALLTEAYPANRRGSAMGLMHMAVAAGLTAGPSLGGLLLQATSWRAIFLVNLPIALVALRLAWLRLPKTSGQRIAGLRLDPSLVSSWPLIAGLLAAFLAFVALASNMFLIPFALQALMDLSPARSGVVMITVPLTILVIAPLSGRVTDRIGPRWPATTGIGLVAVAILLMTQLGPESTMPFTVLTLIVYGAGAGCFQAPNNTAVMTAAPPGARGTISGTLALARSLGQIAGVALAGAIWRWREGVYAASLSADTALARAMRDAFLTLALVASITVVISVLRGGGEQRAADMAHG